MDKHIEFRANILHKYINTSNHKLKDVYIYEDHRSIINVLYDFNQEFGKPVNLIMFDDHDDFVNLSPEAIQIIEDLNMKDNTEQLTVFVEHYLRSLDDNWVKAGMELNLIKNVFLFNSSKSRILDVEEYETMNFGTKKMYNIGNVWTVLSSRGKLEDRIIDEYRELWKDFGWKWENYKFHFEPKFPFILDFDLDAFSTEICDRTMAIPYDILKDKFFSNLNTSKHIYHNTKSLMDELINKAELITMCFESNSCGGINEAHKIFNYLDEFLFNNELGK